MRIHVPLEELTRARKQVAEILPVREWRGPHLQSVLLHGREHLLQAFLESVFKRRDLREHAGSGG